MSSLTRYLQRLTPARLTLWCYLVWYLVVLYRYFDPRPSLWLTSLGLSGIIGCALYLSTTSGANGPARLGFWPTFRLFLMPFCVSSFAALVKDRGFILVFSPQWRENVLAVGVCAGLVLAVRWIQRRNSPFRL